MYYFFWRVILYNLFILGTILPLQSFNVNYGFRQIHGALMVSKIARCVAQKLYFFMVGKKSTRLAEILTFYLRLFSLATVYYGIYSSHEVPLASNVRFFEK